MSTTGLCRSAVARHVGGPHPARPHRSARVIGQTLSRAYSAGTQTPATAETLLEPGPSTLKNVELDRSTNKTHSEASKQPTILLYPSPVVNRSRPNRTLSAPQPLRIPYPQPQTRFEEGFNKRLRVWGLDDATKYLIKVLRAKHASRQQPNQPLKPLGVTQEFLDKVLCALRLSAPVAYGGVEKSKWLKVPVPMPRYAWLDTSNVQRPAPAKALTQAMTLLQIVRDSGRPRPQEHYAALIKAFLARGHIEEATKLYVELVLDWNVQSAAGGKAVSSFATDASDETKRAVEMISPRGDHVGLKRDMPAQIRKETVERGPMPFPQAAMLNAICKHLEMQILIYGSARKHKTSSRVADTTNASGASDRPQLLRPSHQPQLFRALESVRVLSTLLFHNQLPYGATYRSYEPLLKVMSMVPRLPLYTVEVVLPKSEDKDPDASPKWMKVGKFGGGLAEGDKAPHVFTTSLHLFARTVLKAVTGRGDGKKTSVPAAEQKPSTSESESIESS